MFSKKIIFKKAIKNLAKDLKEKIKFYAYKDTLPKNPMHDDVYLVEFPKSGVTWLQHILGNVELQLSGREEIVTFYNHHKYSPDVHQLRGAKINRFLRRTFIKSHSEYNPYYYFVIYLIRNPFDVMVSYYNFLLDSGYQFDSFGQFIKSRNGVIRWKKHVDRWYYKKVDTQRIHLIKYEELLANTVYTISNLYLNLGVDVPQNLLIKAIDLSNMKNMKNSEEYYRRFNPNYTMNFAGKKNKIKKEDLLNNTIKNYIAEVAKSEIEAFYPELLMDNNLIGSKK